jgi:hypothetical protein
MAPHTVSDPERGSIFLEPRTPTRAASRSLQAAASVEPLALPLDRGTSGRASCRIMPQVLADRSPDRRPRARKETDDDIH